jgi:predicted DNA-binding WGR domain protein
VVTSPNLTRSPDNVASFQAYARFVSVDPARNRYRFYSLTWQPSLWGGGALIRTWGRIGTKGRTLETFHEDRGSTRALVEQIVKRRLQRGYQVVDVR